MSGLGSRKQVLSEMVEKKTKNCNSLDVGRDTGGRSKYTSYNPSVMRQTIG